MNIDGKWLILPQPNAYLPYDILLILYVEAQSTDETVNGPFHVTEIFKLSFAFSENVKFLIPENIKFLHLL